MITAVSGFQQPLKHFGVEPSRLSRLLKPSSSLWLPGVRSPFPISAMGGVSISQAHRWAPRGTGETPAGAGGSWLARVSGGLSGEWSFVPRLGTEQGVGLG